MIEIVLCADLLVAVPQGQLEIAGDYWASIGPCGAVRCIYDRVPERGVVSGKSYNFTSESAGAANAKKK